MADEERLADIVSRVDRSLGYAVGDRISVRQPLRHHWWTRAVARIRRRTLPAWEDVTYVCIGTATTCDQYGNLMATEPLRWTSSDSCVASITPATHV